MSYYTQEIYIPQVDENDSIVGKVERWKAHREGILHRGLTVAVYYNDNIICQQRKHPVFDGFLDLTASTHPQYINDTLQSVEEATILTLRREWNINESDIKNITTIGKVIYNSQFQGFIEHEVCYLLSANVKALPEVNLEYAYGYELRNANELKSKKKELKYPLAPWVQSFFNEGLL